MIPPIWKCFQKIGKGGQCRIGKLALGLNPSWHKKQDEYDCYLSYAHTRALSCEHFYRRPTTVGISTLSKRKRRVSFILSLRACDSYLKVALILLLVQHISISHRSVNLQNTIKGQRPQRMGRGRSALKGRLICRRISAPLCRNVSPSFLSF